jgi:hypothetical protein
LVSRANLPLGIESNGRFLNAFSLLSFGTSTRTQSHVFLERIAHNLALFL